MIIKLKRLLYTIIKLTALLLFLCERIYWRRYLSDRPVYAAPLAAQLPKQLAHQPQTHAYPRWLRWLRILRLLFY